MKDEIHPKVRDVVFQDTVSGAQYRVLSAMKADATVTVDGKEYPLVKVHISSASHPYFTGEERIVDIEGRVDKFKARFAAGEAAKDRRAAAAQEAAKRAAAKAAQKSDKAADQTKKAAAK